MDYKNTLAIAAVIMASGFFVRSFQTANAFPQGPNTSLGSNPIFSAYTNNCPETVTTVPNDLILVITDIVMSSNSTQTVTLKTSNGGILGSFKQTYRTGNGMILEGRHHSLNSGIVVPAGEDLILDNCSTDGATISGYYAQP